MATLAVTYYVESIGSDQEWGNNANNSFHRRLNMSVKVSQVNLMLT